MDIFFFFLLKSVLTEIKIIIYFFLNLYILFLFEKERNIYLLIQKKRKNNKVTIYLRIWKILFLILEKWQNILVLRRVKLSNYVKSITY